MHLRSHTWTPPVRRASSVIAATRYNARTRTLQVEFRTGRVYRYFNVPRKVYEELISAPSEGEYFNTRIRNSHRYREMKGR